MPGTSTNAKSEITFSALCRIKKIFAKYHNSTRLNNLMILDVYKNITNLKNIANEFIGYSEHRLKIFAG